MAAKNTIGTKIVIEGEKEYNESLKKIKAQQQELRSEMRLCSETYKENANSAEALKKKQEILTKQIESQSEKVKSQEKMLNAAADAQKKAKEKTEEYKAALEKAEKELIQMESASDTATEALEAQKAEVQEIKNKLELAEQSYGKAQSATTKYQTSLNNSNAELIKMQSEQDKVNEYLEEAQGNIDRCASSIDQYGKEIKEAADESKEFKDKSTQAITALAGTIAAAGIQGKIKDINAALMECSANAKVFSTGMAKVYTIADENIVAQEDMAREITKLSTELTQGTDKLTEATYNAISAGVDTANAASFAGEATKLAVGGFTEASIAVDILTTTLNAYNLKADQTTKISDMLITTQNKGKTTVNELAINMGKVIPLAAAYNVEMDNLSTTYAIMTANGIATAESTTYIKAMLNELGDSGSTVGKTLREKTGQSFADLMKKGYSLGEAIEILGDSVQGDAGAFNELWSSSEAGIGALSLLGSGAGKFLDVLAEMRNSTGATEAAFEKMNEQMAEERFNIAVENFKTAIGTELNESLNKLYNTGANAFDWATEFVQNHPDIVKAIEAVIITLGVAAGALTTVTAAAAALKAVLAVINPTTAIWTLAIGGVVGALTALIATSKDERSEISKNADATKEDAAARKEKIKTIDEEINSEKQRITKIKEVIQTIGQLNNQQKLSAAEQAELTDAVTLLNGLLPELNAEIDEQTGKLTENTEAFLKNASAAAAVEEQNSLVKQRATIYEEMADAQAAAAEAEKIYQEAAEKTSKLTEEYNEAYEKAFAELGDMSLAALACDELGTKLAFLQVEEQETKEAFDATKETLDELNAKYKEVAASIDDTNNATDKAALVQINYRGQIIETTAQTAAKLSELKTAYEEAKNEAEESLQSQTQLFDELSLKSDMSVKQMAENLQSQADVFNQYKDDLLTASMLVEQGLMDEGLLGSLKTLGIDGAGYLHELVAASQEDASAYANVVASYQEMCNAKTSLIEIMADLESGYSKQTDEMLGMQALRYGAMTGATTVAYAQLKDTVEKAMTSMVTTQTNGIDAMVTTVSDKDADMRLAAEGLCAAAISGFTGALVIADDGSSEVFKNSAQSIIDGMVQGIKSGAGMVESAVQDVVNSAVGKIDFSGVVMGVNRQLGEVFG